MQTSVLDMNKEQQSPFPQALRNKETHHFGIIEIKGRVGSDVPFILSKIIDQKQIVPWIEGTGWL